MKRTLCSKTETSLSELPINIDYDLTEVLDIFFHYKKPNLFIEQTKTIPLKSY